MKKLAWKDMSLAPVETMLLLFTVDEGMCIGKYKQSKFFTGWFSYHFTGNEFGLYHEVDSCYWQKLPPLPDVSQTFIKYEVDNHEKI